MDFVLLKTARSLLPGSRIAISSSIESMPDLNENSRLERNNSVDMRCRPLQTQGYVGRDIRSYFLFVAMVHCGAQITGSEVFSIFIVGILDISMSFTGLSRVLL